jgi:hypothetical protein
VAKLTFNRLPAPPCLQLATSPARLPNSTVRVCTPLTPHRLERDGRGWRGMRAAPGLTTSSLHRPRCLNHKIPLHHADLKIPNSNSPRVFPWPKPTGGNTGHWRIWNLYVFPLSNRHCLHNSVWSQALMCQKRLKSTPSPHHAPAEPQVNAAPPGEATPHASTRGWPPIQNTCFLTRSVWLRLRRRPSSSGRLTRRNNHCLFAHF